MASRINLVQRAGFFVDDLTIHQHLDRQDNIRIEATTAARIQGPATRQHGNGPWDVDADVDQEAQKADQPSQSCTGTYP
jgi:hypothetical protein